MSDDRARADDEDLWNEADEYRRARDQMRAVPAGKRERTRPLAQAEIEAGIAAIVADLETSTEQYAELSDHEALAENAYKAKYHRAIVSLAADGTMPDGRKSTVDWREAQASIMSEDEAALYRIASAHLKASKEALVTKRSRLDALRTLAANVRGLS